MKKFSDHSEELCKLLREKPEHLISCMGLAIFNVLYGEYEEENIPKQKVNARIYNYEPITPMRSLKSKLIGKFIAIRGTVIRVSNIKPLVLKMGFKCSKCGAINTVRFNEGIYETPTNCETQGCRGNSLENAKI